MSDCLTGAVPEEAMVIARRVASTAARRYKNNPLTEDIYATAYLAMVEQWTARPTEGPWEGWLTTVIQNAVTNMICDSAVVRVPRRSKMRLKEAGIPVPRVEAIAEGWEPEDTRADQLTLEELPLTDVEKKVVDMLASGYNVTEVATATGINRRALYRVREEIKRKTYDYLY